MNLLSRQQASTVHGKKRDDDIAQVAYLTVTLEKLQKQINEENDNFSKRMVEQRDLYNAEKVQLQAEVRTLEAKVHEEERKLIESLLPVQEYGDRAQEVLSNTQIKAVSLLTREEEVSRLEELLTDKLDDLTEREIRIKENETRIQSTITGLEEEKTMVSESHKRLNDELLAFNLERKNKLKELEEFENSIMVKKAMNEQYLELRKKELDEKETALKDKREAFDRAFTELQTLQGNKK